VQQVRRSLLLLRLVAAPAVRDELHGLSPPPSTSSTVTTIAIIAIIKTEGGRATWILVKQWNSMMVSWRASSSSDMSHTLRLGENRFLGTCSKPPIHSQFISSENKSQTRTKFTKGQYLGVRRLSTELVGGGLSCAALPLDLSGM
jgi:hypothetical protein